MCAAVRGAARGDRAGEHAARCIVIGEDLGTVPEGFREAMADWGLWSYLVLLFERRHDGSFKAPVRVSRPTRSPRFSTHDLPTFTGWRERP